MPSPGRAVRRPPTPARPDAVTSRPPAAKPSELTIDELAATTGASSRTIRFYQSAGVLMPPHRRGRVALYRRDHVERLALVELLQRRGLRLRAIRDLLGSAASEMPTSVGGWLGLGRRLARPWAPEAAERVSRADLADRLRGTGATIPVLERARLLERAPGRGGYLISNPRLFGVVLALGRAGVDAVTATGAGAILRRHLGNAADELVSHFTERVGRGFAERATPEAVEQALDALRPLAVEAVQLIFAGEIERRLRALAAGVPPEAEADAEPVSRARSRRR